jgi:uncharacterized protein (TIGR00255 family)
VIKSMTGFAAVTLEDGAATIAVTVRSVNHRHLDVQVRVPTSLAAMENTLRGVVGQRVARGRVEVSVSLQLRTMPVVDVEFNETFGRALEDALDRARTAGLVSGALTPGDLLRLPQALTIRERADADDALLAGATRLTLRAVTAALDDLDAMRLHEGEHLRADLGDRCASASRYVEQIATAAEAGRSALERRLTERVQQLRSLVEVDETAVAQEVVRVALRSDIAEELSRFRAHVAHWATLTASPEPCGRKLDFLLQEMNREVNTMGSKADGLGVADLVIAAKAELERMREQVQNVE